MIYRFWNIIGPLYLCVVCAQKVTAFAAEGLDHSVAFGISPANGHTNPDLNEGAQHRSKSKALQRIFMTSNESSVTTPVVPVILALPAGVLFAPVGFVYGPNRSSAFPESEHEMDAHSGTLRQQQPQRSGADDLQSQSASGAGNGPVVQCADVASLRCYLPNTVMLDPIPDSARTVGATDRGGPAGIATGSCSMDEPQPINETLMAPPPAAAVLVYPSDGMVEDPLGDTPFTAAGIPLSAASQRWWPVPDAYALAAWPGPNVTGTAPSGPRYCLAGAYAQAALDGNASDGLGTFPVAKLGSTILRDGGLTLEVVVLRLTALLLVYGTLGTNETGVFGKSTPTTTTTTPLRDDFDAGLLPYCPGLIPPAPSQPQPPSVNNGSGIFGLLFTAENAADRAAGANTRQSLTLQAYAPFAKRTSWSGAVSISNKISESAPIDIILPTVAYTESGISPSDATGRGQKWNVSWQEALANIEAAPAFVSMTSFRTNTDPTSLDYGALDLLFCTTEYLVLAMGQNQIESQYVSVFPSDAILRDLHDCLQVPLGPLPYPVPLVMGVHVAKSTLTVQQYFLQNPSLEQSSQALISASLGSPRPSSPPLLPPVCAWTFTADDVRPSDDTHPVDQSFFISSTQSRHRKTVSFWTSHTKSSAATETTATNDENVVPTSSSPAGLPLGLAGVYLGALPLLSSTPSVASSQCFLFGAFSAIVGPAKPVSLVDKHCLGVVTPPTTRDLYAMMAEMLFLLASPPILGAFPAACTPNALNASANQDIFDAPPVPITFNGLSNEEALCALVEYVMTAPDNGAALGVQLTCAADGQTLFVLTCDAADHPPQSASWAEVWSTDAPVTFPGLANISTPPYYAATGGVPLLALTKARAASLGLSFHCSVCESFIATGAAPAAPLPPTLIVLFALKDALVIVIGIWALSFSRIRKWFVRFAAAASTIFLPFSDAERLFQVREVITRALVPVEVTPFEMVRMCERFVVSAGASTSYAVLTKLLLQSDEHCEPLESASEVDGDSGRASSMPREIDSHLALTTDKRSAPSDSHLLPSAEDNPPPRCCVNAPLLAIDINGTSSTSSRRPEPSNDAFIAFLLQLVFHQCQWRLNRPRWTALLQSALKARDASLDVITEGYYSADADTEALAAREVLARFTALQQAWTRHEKRALAIPSKSTLQPSAVGSRNAKRDAGDVDECADALQKTTLALWEALDRHALLEPVVFADARLDARITPPPWLLLLHLLFCVTYLIVIVVSVATARNATDVQWSAVYPKAVPALSSLWSAYEAVFFRYINSSTAIGLVVDAILRVVYAPQPPPNLRKCSSYHLGVIWEAVAAAGAAVETLQITTDRAAENNSNQHREHQQKHSSKSARQCEPLFSPDEGDEAHTHKTTNGSATVEMNAEEKRAVWAAALVRTLIHRWTFRGIVTNCARSPFVVAGLLLPLPVLITHAIPGAILYAWVVGPLIAVVVVASAAVHRAVEWWMGPTRGNRRPNTVSSSSNRHQRRRAAGRGGGSSVISVRDAVIIVAARLAVRLLITVGCVLALQSTVNWMILAYSGGGGGGGTGRRLAIDPYATSDAREGVPALTVPNTFLFRHRFPAPASVPDNQTAVIDTEHLQDNLYLSYLGILALEWESRTFACTYEMLLSSIEGAAQFFSVAF